GRERRSERIGDGAMPPSVDARQIEADLDLDAMVEARASLEAVEPLKVARGEHVERAVDSAGRVGDDGRDRPAPGDGVTAEREAIAAHPRRRDEDRAGAALRHLPL